MRWGRRDCLLLGLGGVVQVALILYSLRTIPGHDISWTGDARDDRAFWSLVTYWLAASIAWALAWLFQRRVRQQAPGQAWRLAAAWFHWWLGCTVAITAAGALVGMVLFLAMGWLMAPGAPASQLMRQGAWNIGFLAFVWAPGLSLVLAMIRAHGLPRPHARPRPVSGPSAPPDAAP